MFKCLRVDLFICLSCKRFQEVGHETQPFLCPSFHGRKALNKSVACLPEGSHSFVIGIQAQRRNPHPGLLRFPNHATKASHETDVSLFLETIELQDL